MDTHIILNSNENIDVMDTNDQLSTTSSKTKKTKSTTCDECFKIISIKNMKRHKTICNNKKKKTSTFLCEICGKIKTKDHKKRHITKCSERITEILKNCTASNEKYNWRNYKKPINENPMIRPSGLTIKEEFESTLLQYSKEELQDIISKAHNVLDTLNAI